jgi:hypothetical protein
MFHLLFKIVLLLVFQALFRSSGRERAAKTIQFEKGADKKSETGEEGNTKTTGTSPWFCGKFSANAALQRHT